MTRDLRGRIVWVPGADGGIGRAVVTRLRDAGATVVATDLADGGGTAGVVRLRCDLRNADDVREVMAATEDLGGVDGLVNCAAAMHRSDIFDITPQQWDDLFAVNVKAAYFCAVAAARQMRDHGRGGCLVQMCSLGSEIPRPEIVSYGATKGAVHAMVGGLAVALAPYEIRSVGLMPGTIDTPMGADRWQIPGARRAAEDKIPLKRLGHADEIANVAAFLLSDEASYLTGSVVRVDGGRLVRG